MVLLHVRIKNIDSGLLSQCGIRCVLDSYRSRYPESAGNDDFARFCWNNWVHLRNYRILGSLYFWPDTSRIECRNEPGSGKSCFNEVPIYVKEFSPNEATNLTGSMMTCLGSFGLFLAFFLGM